MVGRLMVGRYTMLEANDPIVGLELAKQAQPDLILLDMNLPNMNGLDVGRRLLNILKPGTPILALSADSDPEIRARTVAAGFSGFVNKPIDIDAFYKLLNEFLHEKHEKPISIVTVSGSLQPRGVRLFPMH